MVDDCERDEVDEAEEDVLTEDEVILTGSKLEMYQSRRARKDRMVDRIKWGSSSNFEEKDDDEIEHIL